MDKKIFYKKIKKCLNNEKGGPNLENMLGIAFSLAITTAVVSFANSTYGWIHDASDVVEIYKPDNSK